MVHKKRIARLVFLNFSTDYIRKYTYAVNNLFLGLSVRAFVRDPAKVPDHLKDKLEIFEGNVLEPDSVHDAVEGTDGVVIVLGTRNSLEPTSDMSEGTRNIIEAMRAKNVTTVSACLSAFLFYAPEKVPPRFNDLNDDHKRMYLALKESGLNYIAVYPPHIAGKLLTFTYLCLNFSS